LPERARYGTFPNMQNRLHYIGGTLDRANTERRSSDWVMEQLNHAESRILPIWRDKNLIFGEDSEAVMATGQEARDVLEHAGEVVLLGTNDGIAYFVADLSHHEEDAIAGLTGERTFVDLRQVGPSMERHQATLLAYARGISFWHKRQRFCGDCGHETESMHGGHMRQCLNPDCRREHFPRTDPAVIMLVHRVRDGKDSILLAHKANFPAGMYSILAGFVDQGESLEETVVREVYEEARIRVTDVKYQSSQPWPFPASLMMGFTARATTDEITVDLDELENGFWFTREELREFGAGDRRLPRTDSIARILIDDWINKTLEV
jgi:NAD+ diphosphatase